MADVVNVVPKGYTENPDLMPIPLSSQKYGGATWTLMMFSMNTCIPMFFLGPIGMSLGLSFWQALWGSLIGNLAAVIVMWLNGVFGVRHAVGYPAQVRGSFGFRGAHVPVILRGISGLMWFGIEAWAGSLAITMIIVAIAGVPKDMVTAVAIKYLIISLVFYLAPLFSSCSSAFRESGRWPTGPARSCSSTSSGWSSGWQPALSSRETRPRCG